jgi:hypothetical protein
MEKCKAPDPCATASITGSMNRDAGGIVHLRLGDGLDRDAARLGGRFESLANPRIGAAKA